MYAALMMPNPQSSSASFAGVIATLAMPASDPYPEPAFDDFASDVATLSKESRGFSQQEFSVQKSTEKQLKSSVRGKKNSSITIRLSEEECLQLHQRAAAAGLTISAYLRLCTVEVEAMRTSVKEILAQMRHSASIEVKTTPAKSVWQNWYNKLHKIFMPGAGTSLRTAVGQS